MLGSLGQCLRLMQVTVLLYMHAQEGSIHAKKVAHTAAQPVRHHG
jgi:hypothetical protein